MAGSGGGGGCAKSGGISSSSSSSGEEDGDAEWRAAIESVAAADFSGPTRIRPPAAAAAGSKRGAASDDEKPKTPGLKLYQIKVVPPTPFLFSMANAKTPSVFSFFLYDFKRPIFCYFKISEMFQRSTALMGRVK